MDRSLIWSALGRMSRQGLLPIPIEDISARRISEETNFSIVHTPQQHHHHTVHSFTVTPTKRSFDSSSVHTLLISSDMDCRVNVSLGFLLRNQISNLVGLSPIFAVRPMEPPSLAEEDKLLEQKHMTKALLPLPLPHEELILAHQPSLLLHVHLKHCNVAAQARVCRLTSQSRSESMASRSLPCLSWKRTISSADLSSDTSPSLSLHAFMSCCSNRAYLPILCTGLRSSQATRGTHVSQEALSHLQGTGLALLQLLQEILVVELKDLFHVAEYDVALTSHGLRDILAQKLRNIYLFGHPSLPSVVLSPELELSVEYPHLCPSSPHSLPLQGAPSSSSKFSVGNCQVHDLCRCLLPTGGPPLLELPESLVWLPLHLVHKPSPTLFTATSPSASSKSSALSRTSRMSPRLVGLAGQAQSSSRAGEGGSQQEQVWPAA
uniref:Uncharacterized protein n=1 Tax=Timema poppense TaxID=170557 RepID=A0A7R9CJ23_TIMPO|nr:unnamed protein product [Timema poppensis]